MLNDMEHPLNKLVRIISSTVNVDVFINRPSAIADTITQIFSLCLINLFQNLNAKT